MSRIYSASYMEKSATLMPPQAQRSLLLQQLAHFNRYMRVVFRIDALAALRDDNLFSWEIKFTGPKDSLYEGGLFAITMEIPQVYPVRPPRIRFETPMWHPDIDDEGNLCLATLRTMPPGPLGGPKSTYHRFEQFAPHTLFANMLTMLVEPQLTLACNHAAATEYLYNYNVYAQKVTQLTKETREGQEQVGVETAVMERMERQKMLENR